VSRSLRLKEPITVKGVKTVWLHESLASRDCGGAAQWIGCARVRSVGVQSRGRLQPDADASAGFDVARNGGWLPADLYLRGAGWIAMTPA